MTWEIDIVQRSGKLTVAGQFKIKDAAETTTFLARFHDLLRKSGITVDRPVIPTAAAPAPQSPAKIVYAPKQSANHKGAKR